MLRRRQAVESIAPHAFWPPFCPWPDCRSHGSRAGGRFRRHGSFTRRSDGRVVPRYRCLVCGRTCSQQTFSSGYYSKRPELLHDVAAGLVAGSAHRQLARSLDCSPSSVTRIAARLGRHALLLQARLLEQLRTIDEPVVYDDFESFVYSQDHPFGMGTAVGQRSWFVYGIEHAPHRRGGKRRLRRRRAPGAAERSRGAYARAFAATVDLLLGKADPQRPLQLVTDGHPAYRAGLRRHPRREHIVHRSYPNPPRGPRGSPRSAVARERDRQMFAVDLLHKLIRHSQAHHRRETIAFGRRLNALLERGFLLAVWRNLVKGRSERRPDRSTPAMGLGLAAEPWRWSDVLAQRLFPWRIRVPRRWMAVYRRELVTPILGPNRRHTLVNAF